MVCSLYAGSVAEPPEWEFGQFQSRKHNGLSVCSTDSTLRIILEETRKKMIRRQIKSSFEVHMPSLSHEYPPRILVEYISNTSYTII